MRRFITKLLMAALILSPVLARGQQEQMPLNDLKTINERWPNAKKTALGMRYVIEIEGTGDYAKRGDVVEVLYVGKTLDGKIFDKEENVMTPFKFRIGRGDVIAGWEIGLQLMKKGGKITLIVPPSLGYGTKGDVPHGIGRNAVLVFEVSMLNIIRGEEPVAPAPPAKK